VSFLIFSYRSEAGLGKVRVPGVQAEAIIFLSSVKELAD
jgi:hypothetical protein